MKVGETVPISIDGVEVGFGEIREVDGDEATIVIPATRLRVKVKQSLDLAATREPETDRMLAGTEVASGTISSDAITHVNAVPEGAYTPDGTVGEGIHGRNLDSSALD